MTVRRLPLYDPFWDMFRQVKAPIAASVLDRIGRRRRHMIEAHMISAGDIEPPSVPSLFRLTLIMTTNNANQHAVKSQLRGMTADPAITAKGRALLRRRKSASIGVLKSGY